MVKDAKQKHEFGFENLLKFVNDSGKSKSNTKKG